MAKKRNNTKILKRDSRGRITKAVIKNPEHQSVSRRNNGSAWTTKDLKVLEDLAQSNTPTRVIGLKLGRSEASVRNKAQLENISLKPVNRSPNKGRKIQRSTKSSR